MYAIIWDSELDKEKKKDENWLRLIINDPGTEDQYLKLWEGRGMKDGGHLHHHGIRLSSVPPLQGRLSPPSCRHKGKRLPSPCSLSSYIQWDIKSLLRTTWNWPRVIVLTYPKRAVLGDSTCITWKIFLKSVHVSLFSPTTLAEVTPVFTQKTKQREQYPSFSQPAPQF